MPQYRPSVAKTLLSYVVERLQKDNFAKSWTPQQHEPNETKWMNCLSDQRALPSSRVEQTEQSTEVKGRERWADTHTRGQGRQESRLCVLQAEIWMLIGDPTQTDRNVGANTHRWSKDAACWRDFIPIPSTHCYRRCPSVRLLSVSFCIVLGAIVNTFSTRKLSYRKDDRAMRPIYTVRLKKGDTIFLSISLLNIDRFS